MKIWFPEEARVGERIIVQHKGPNRKQRRRLSRGKPKMSLSRPAVGQIVNIEEFTKSRFRGNRGQKRLERLRAEWDEQHVGIKESDSPDS